MFMKRKFIYFITAFVMALTLSVSGVGNSYIKAEASSGLLDPLWNTEASTMENIRRHLVLWGSVAGVAISPNLISAGWLAVTASEFYDFMINDGYPEDVANAVCHGGGGFVRDGINRDKDGNVTYSDEVSDLFYNYLCHYMDTENGYYVVETMAPEDFSPECFSSELLYNNFIQTCKNLDLFYARYTCSPDSNLIKEFTVLKFDGSYFVLRDNISDFSPSTTQVYTCEANYSTEYAAKIKNFQDSSSNILPKLSNGPLTWSSFSSSGGAVSTYFDRTETSSGKVLHCKIISSDGRLVRVFKSRSHIKNFNNKSQGFFVSQQFYSYNVSNINTLTLTNSEYQYYVDNSTTIYQNIYNNINTGNNLTDDDIRKIIEDTIKEFKDTIPEEDTKTDNDVDNDKEDDTGGGTVSGNDTGGNGLNDFVGGLGSLLDFLLSLFGKVIGLISDFLNSALELLGNLTSFTDGFSTFLSSTFKFLPEEAITLICSGIALVITLGIIKYMRN